jgi:hypothetical protein
MQIGAGYSLPLSSDRNNNLYYANCLTYFGQNPCTETQNITNIRAGVALKGGQEKIQEATICPKSWAFP